MAKFETLVELFPTGIGAAWGFGGGGTDTWVANTDGTGQVQETIALNTVSNFYTAATYDLTSSYVGAKIFFPVGTGNLQQAYEVSDSQTSGTNRARFYQDGVNNFTYTLVTGGSTVTTSTVTYDAVNFAWCRFSESGGTLSWLTSPDGATWTSRLTATTPTWGTNMTVLYTRLRTNKFGTEDPALAASISYVNTLPPSLVPAPVVPVGAVQQAASW